MDYGDFEEPWHERAFLCYDERDPERLWVLTPDGDIYDEGKEDWSNAVVGQVRRRNLPAVLGSENRQPVYRFSVRPTEAQLEAALDTAQDRMRERDGDGPPEALTDLPVRLNRRITGKRPVVPLAAREAARVAVPMDSSQHVDGTPLGDQGREWVLAEDYTLGELGTIVVLGPNAVTLRDRGVDIVPGGESWLLSKG